jgi:tRNA threonylcarbamoyladenosine biosynthesis protein TsaE
MELIIPGQQALFALLPQVVEGLAHRKKIALYGEMGAGKTTFVNAFTAFLGIQGHAASPTFSLINQYTYQGLNGQNALFHHLDLYRLRSLQEALDIGIEDLLYDVDYCVIEWPQVIEALLPEGCAKIHLEITGENSRKMLIL